MATKKLSKKNYNYKETQLHAGRRNGRKGGETLWHTNSDGKYWCGSWHKRTPLGLLKECKSTIQDLLKHHPELGVKL